MFQGKNDVFPDFIEISHLLPNDEVQGWLKLHLYQPT